MMALWRFITFLSLFVGCSNAVSTFAELKRQTAMIESGAVTSLVIDITASITITDSTYNITVPAGSNLTLTSNRSTTLTRQGTGALSLFQVYGTLNLYGLDFFDITTSTHGGVIRMYTTGSTSIVGSSFRNGTASGRGGCIYSTSTSGTLKVWNTSFTYCTASSQGGAVGMLGATVATMTNVDFKGNHGTSGADVFTRDGISLVMDTITSTHSAVSQLSTGIGGCLYADTTDYINISNGVFYDNRAANDGLALYIDTATVFLSDLYFTAFVDNGGANSQGCIYATASTITASNLKFRDGTIAKGGALYLHGGTTLTLDYIECIRVTSTGAGGACLSLDDSTSATIESAKVINCTSALEGVVLVDTAALTLSNAIFDGNSASDNDGGAVYLRVTDHVNITNATFRNNVGDNGGGIYCDQDTNLLLNKVTAYDNVGLSDGGFLYAIQTSRIDVIDSYFYNNIAGGYGGAFAIGSASSTAVYITGSNFTNNQASTGGGALYLSGATSPFGVQILDSVFQENSCGDVGGGAIFGLLSSFYVEQSEFINNNATDGDGLSTRCTGDSIFVRTKFTSDIKTYRPSDAAVVQSSRLAMDTVTFTHSTHGVRGVEMISSVVTAAAPVIRNTEFGNFSYYCPPSATCTVKTCSTSTDLAMQYDEVVGYDVYGFDTSAVEVCANDATCTNADVGVSCACSTGAPLDYLNSDGVCAPVDPTPAPTTLAPTYSHAPTTATPTEATYYSISSKNAYVKLEDPPAEIDYMYFGFLGITGIVVILTFTMDVTKIRGMTQDERDGWVVWSMTKTPSYFHILACAPRQKYLDLVDRSRRSQINLLAPEDDEPGTAGTIGNTGASAFDLKQVVPPTYEQDRDSDDDRLDALLGLGPEKKPAPVEAQKEKTDRPESRKKARPTGDMERAAPVDGEKKKHKKKKRPTKD